MYSPTYDEYPYKIKFTNCNSERFEWCCEKFGKYGPTWDIDDGSVKIYYFKNKNDALLVALRWSEK